MPPRSFCKSLKARLPPCLRSLKKKFYNFLVLSFFFILNCVPSSSARQKLVPLWATVDTIFKHIANNTRPRWEQCIKGRRNKPEFFGLDFSFRGLLTLGCGNEKLHRMRSLKQIQIQTEYTLCITVCVRQLTFPLDLHPGWMFKNHGGHIRIPISIGCVRVFV